MGMVSLEYNFVFSMDYGIGLILEEKDNLYKIKYENKIIEDANQFSFQFIDPKLASNLLEKKYESFFKYSSLERGIEYFNLGNVRNFYLVGDTIVGKVKGQENNNYTQNIRYEKGHFINSCSCPVEKGCKHVVAVIALISSKMNDLISDSSFESNNTLKQALDAYKYTKTLSEGLLQVLVIKDLIKTVFDVEEALEFMNKNHVRYNMDSLIYLLAFNDRINRLLPDVSFNLKSLGIYKSIISSKSQISDVFEEPFNNYSDFFKIIYYLLNDDYYYALKLILSSESNFKRFSKLLPKLSTLIEPSNELIDLFLNNYSKKFSYDNDLNLFVKNILKNANQETKIKVYLYLGLDLNLGEDEIDLLPSDAKIKLIRNFRSADSAIKYLDNNFNELINVNNKELAISLYTLYQFASKNYKLIAKELLERIDNTNFIIDILINKKYFENYNMDDFKYFDFKYNIDDYFDSLKIDLSIYLGEIHLMTLSYLDNSIDKVYFDSSISHLYMDKKLPIEIKKILYQLDDFNIKLDAINKKIANKKNILMIKKYNDSIDLLNQNLEYESYNKTGLITLKPEIIYYYDTKELKLELKIGRDKFYVIKSLPILLDSIKNHDIFKYGKSLEFNHHINNFDSKSKDLINLLLLIESNNDEIRYLNPRYIPLNGYVLEKLFEIYKDSIITINNNDYLLSLNEIKLEAKIDDNYILNCNIDNKNTIITPNNIYYINDIDKSILKVISTDDNIKLYSFLINNNGMNTNLVLDKFKNDIYSRFPNEIIISDSLKNDFKLSELIIDAYFDFDGKAISINTKIYKENQEIDMNIADKAKLDRFEKYIRNLGFEDNKIKEEADIYNFLIMDFKELKELANVFLSDSLKNKTISKMNMANIRIIYTGTLMDAFLEESIYSEDELYQILSAIKKRKKYVLLSNDRIIDINNNESKEFYDTVVDLKLDLKHLLTKKQIPTYQAIKALSHEANCSIDDFITNMINELTNFKNANFIVPKINGSLREYQKEGYNFLKILSNYGLGGILADDMGLGKTLEIITLLLSDNLAKPSLIVCPKSLIFNWLNEFEKFSDFKNIKCLVGSINERHKIESNIKEDKTIYIIGYNTLSNDLEYLSNISFNYIILDEAQYIKNTFANKTKSVKQLDGLHKFALTGTPIENNIIDLWSIFDFIMPEYLDSILEFKSKYLASDEYVEIVKKKVQPFILRRKKEDVLKDLPPKISRIISVDMTNMQRKLYDAYKLEANQAIKNGGSSFEMLPYITRLRQICVDPSTYIENYEGGSGKTNEILKLISEYIENGHRILVFSSFVQALNIIEVNLAKDGINYYKITGDVDSKERLRLVDSFNQNDSIKVFLISLKAGGTGLNLVGADTVFHMDPWWNISAENQATDRAHRIGQTKTVEVIKIVCDDSIEQRVIELQNIKKDLVDRVIAKDDSSITGFTLEDINYILR